MAITVSGIFVYPVKALGGISLAESIVTPRGLKHDRRFLVVTADNEFVTQREYPKMATVWVELEGGTITFSAPDIESVSFPADPQASATRVVRVWASQVAAQAVSLEADRWLSDYLGFDAHLVYMPDSSERAVNPEYGMPGDIVSFADGSPLLIASEESLADLNARIVHAGGAALPMNRFRPNVVIKGCEAFAEDRLGEIRIGDAIFRAVKPCPRCEVTTTDQAAGVVRGPEPLQTLATYRDSPKGIMFGVNLIPVGGGSMRVGDTVVLAPRGA